MPERASVFEVAQLGVEALGSPGTQVAANKRMTAIGLAIDPKTTTSRFRPVGYKFDTLVIPGKEWADYKVTGKLDFTNVIYPFSSVINSPTISTPGGGTNDRDWSFISSTTAPDLPQTFTIDSGSAFRAQRTAGAIFTEFGASFKRDMIDLSGAITAQQIQDGVTITGPSVQTVHITNTTPPTGGTFTLTWSAQTTAGIAWNATAGEVQQKFGALSNVGVGNIIVTGGPGPSTDWVITFVGTLTGTQPAITGTSTGLTGGTGLSITVAQTQTGTTVTEITALPVTPGNVDVYLDALPGNIGVSKLNRVISADAKITARYKPLWVLNSSNGSWVATVEAPPDVTVKLMLEADSSGMSFLPLLRAGSSTYVRIKAVGPAFPAPDAAQNYTFTWDFAVKPENLDSLADSDGVEAVSWTLRAVHDTTLGYATKVVVRNLATAL